LKQQLQKRPLETTTPKMTFRNNNSKKDPLKQQLQKRVLETTALIMTP